MKKLIDLAILDRLDRLIRRKATGSPAELAKRLGVSRSTLFELIAYLKDEMRAPIIYVGGRQSYVYEYTPKFYLGFERDHLKTTEMINTCGGGDEKEKRRHKVEIEIDDDEYILDDDIDFNDLYH
jgi:predicted DNA-binding transcriptional regulator YafY